MAGAETYTPGYCTWYVARSLPWVRGGWGNAWQWAARASAQGFHLTAKPAVGSVVVYGPGHGYSEYGHVAIVKAVFPLNLFLVSEMAAVALYTVSQRVSNMHDVSAFILAPGSADPANLALPKASPAPGLEAAVAAWGALADTLNHRLPAATAALALARSAAEHIT